ncbi:MAG TPA: S-adenosylmethionine decarboxylase [Gaiellaceae bacterium]|nr:S-adenosylmethionine decarboxylase [Gaiellaceae bacterium]
MHGLLDRAHTMRLYTMDAWVSDPAVLTDEPLLRTALHAGAQIGGATVLGEEFHIFGNGAVTGVLVLAQSHLSIHTWPELALANVDLLSYGDVRGGDVLGEIRTRLGVERSTITCVPRAVA